VEAKALGKRAMSPALSHFNRQTGADHEFHVAMVLPFVDSDCFDLEEPTIVPAATILSQMV
jgi:hypothetical protein